MRLGIMGGTFDPIHYAHLFIAEDARIQFQLDRVLFIPNGVPPHKKSYSVSSAEDRFAMTQLAVASNLHFHSSRLEIDRDGPSYAVDTLTCLRRQYPVSELFFITGIDAIAEILTWKRSEEVLHLCSFIAAARPGYPLEMLADRLPASYLAHIFPLPSSHLAISSTDIRRRVREGLPIRYLTPDPVVEYIYQHYLYRG